MTANNGVDMESAESVMRLGEHPEALEEPIRSFVLRIMARVDVARKASETKIMVIESGCNGGGN